MYCCDTNKLEAVFAGKIKLVHVPELACQDVSKLSRLIRVFKQLFRGSGRILLTLSGGRIDDMKIGEAVFDESKDG